MRSLKITNHGTGDYTVVVDHISGNTSTHNFDNHGRLTAFVQALKIDGYIVVNDQY